MYNLKFIEFIATICDKEFYKKIFKELNQISKDLSLITFEMTKYFIGYTKFFKKLKTKDIVVIRYTDWKKRKFETDKIINLGNIHIPKSWHDLDNVENLIEDFIAKRYPTKFLKKNEEIIGIVLKTWNGVRKRYYPNQFGTSEILTKFNAAAILGGDTIYIVYDLDWLQGIEIVTPETENMNLFQKIKWFF